MIDFHREIDKNKKGELIKKTEDLYLYFLFLEILHSSETIGSITAEKNRSKIGSISANQPPSDTSGYSSESDAPPTLPENIETEEPEEGIEQTAESFFKEPEDENPVENKIFEDERMEVFEEEEDESP